MRAGAAAATLAATLMLPAMARAQLRQPERWIHLAAAEQDSVTGAPLDPASPFALPVPRRELVGDGPWWAPLASAVVPGTGQLAQGQRRGVPYLAMEAFLLVQFFRVRHDARDLRSEYQRLAQVGRSFFTSSFPTGDFEYYERMESFVSSGAYDLATDGVLEPETDTTTFNGFTWQLARRTFWEDPESPPPRDSDPYLRAVEFYQERAVTDEFRWSWQNAQLEQDLFRQTIQRSNSAFRASSQLLGVLIANHALSAIDAFIVIRLSHEPGPAGDRYEVRGAVPWAPLGRGADPAGRP